jgi:hypothetical protein
MLNTSILSGAEEGAEPEWLIPLTGGFGEKTEGAVRFFQNNRAWWRTGR